MKNNGKGKIHLRFRCEPLNNNAANHNWVWSSSSKSH